MLLANAILFLIPSNFQFYVSLTYSKCIRWYLWTDDYTVSGTRIGEIENVLKE